MGQFFATFLTCLVSSKISIQSILLALLMLCGRQARRPLDCEQRPYNKKVCRYIEEGLPRKKFGIGPHGAAQDPNLLSAARWWFVPMAIEYSIRQSGKDRQSAIRILTQRCENCDYSHQSRGLILKSFEYVQTEAMICFLKKRKSIQVF